MMAASKDKTAETSLVEAAQKYLDQVKRLIDSGMTQFLTIGWASIIYHIHSNFDIRF